MFVSHFFAGKSSAVVVLDSFFFFEGQKSCRWSRETVAWEQLYENLLSIGRLRRVVGL